MINNSRKSTHSVMNHRGYGSLFVERNGYKVLVPKEYLFKNGKLKKRGRQYIEEQLALAFIREVI